jgi:hypothetical protein
LNVAALRGEILETVEGVDTGELEEALGDLVDALVVDDSAKEGGTP